MVVLDKTGTITRGQPAVTDVVLNGWHGTQDELLRLTASAEKGSEHPLGEAIVAAAGARGLVLAPLAGFSAEAGQGITATVDGRQVLVGTQAMMAGRGLALNGLERSWRAWKARPRPPCWPPSTGTWPASSPWPTRSKTARSKPSPSCAAWACGW